MDRLWNNENAPKTMFGNFISFNAANPHKLVKALVVKRVLQIEFR